ncbi:unnamed protein product [Sphagnum balticum]
MDLSGIKDKQFLVAVATGNPDGVKFLCSTVHGPYDFTEMVQEVGDMWNVHQHHAKVIVASKDVTKRVEMLDENTVDYIECHATDIITEAMLGGAFDGEPKEFTCRAGLIVEEETTDPRLKKAEDATESDTLSG